MSEPAVTAHPLEFRIVTGVRPAGVHVLAVHGDADLHTAPELRERLADAIDTGARTVVLDLTETTFLDSMALGVMIGALKRMRARDGQLRLVVTRDEVRRILEITQLHRVFPLDESLDEALSSVAD